MIKIPAYGGYIQLQYVPLPECGYTQGANIKIESIDHSHCVQVKTHACGVNYADVCIRWGLYSSAKEYVGLPITPGFEFSGVITKVGKNVEGFTVGDKIVGVTLFGGYSEKILVPANQIHHVPDNMSMSEAAGLMCVGLTAWYAIFELCKLRKNDDVLVHSAAGGVGSMLVQMLKNVVGCNVVGIVGKSHKCEIAKQLGCDSVIDKSVDPEIWTTASDLTVKGYKAIFDANGVDTLQDSYRHLCPGGRLISYGSHTMLPRSTELSTGEISVMEWARIGWRYKRSPTFNPMEMTSDNKSLMCFNLSYMFSEKELIKTAFSDLFSWVADGSLRVATVSEYQLEKVADAHRALESGQTVGKLVMLTNNDLHISGVKCNLEDSNDNSKLLTTTEC